MNPALKPFLYFLCGGVLLCLVSIFIWIVVNGSHNDILFGRVVAVNSSAITIANRQNEQTVISITAATPVSRNRSELRIVDVEVNNFVQVTLTKDEELVAESIRLIRSPREDTNHGPSQ